MNIIGRFSPAVSPYKIGMQGNKEAKIVENFVDDLKHLPVDRLQSRIAKGFYDDVPIGEKYLGKFQQIIDIAIPKQIIPGFDDAYTTLIPELIKRKQKKV